MRQQQFLIKVFSLWIFILSSITISAQTLSRAQLFNNIVTNVYTNPNHAITGQTLQNVLLNQNYSYHNLKSDTDFVSVFDTGFTYSEGMPVVTIGDSLYRCNVPSHHGPWNNNDFRFVQAMGIGGGGISGGGDTQYIPVFTGPYSIGDSHIIDGKAKKIMLDGLLLTSVDWGKRLLYNGNSTNFLTWGNGIKPSFATDIISKGYADSVYTPRIIGNGSNPYVPVFAAGNVLANSHIIDGGGVEEMTDISANVAIDWNKRELFNTGASGYLTWDNGTAPSKPTDIISKGYADITYTGGTSSSGNAPYLAVFTASHTLGNSHILDGGGNQQMLDNSSMLSIDWLNRNLYSNGATSYLTWGNGTAPSFPTDIISKGYADATYIAGALTAGSGAPYVAVFTAASTLGNSHILDGAGTQQMLDNSSTLSIDWLNRSLSSSGATSQLTWGNGTTPSAPTDIISKGYADATYTGGGGGISSTGSATYVPVFTATNAVGNSHIIDGGGSQQMLDNASNISIDWLNRSLYGASTIPLTWGNGVNPFAQTDIICKGYADVNYNTLLGSTGGYHGPVRPVISAETWLGPNAGYGGAATDLTTFIGTNAGSSAVGAHRSTFLGAYAGYQAAGSWNAVFIGDSAGCQDRLSSSSGWSILIGPKTNTGGFNNSIALGGNTSNTAPNQLYIADNINNFHLAGNTFKVPQIGGTLAILNYRFDIPMVTNYRLPSSDFDGQTIVEIIGGPTAVATMPSPASVAKGFPVIIKATGNPATTMLNVLPFGTEMIDNNTAGLVLTMSTAQSPQPCIKILTPDNINWITIP